MLTENSPRLSWVSGSPWRDMRLHARSVEPGSGTRVMDAKGLLVLGRRPRWVLTSTNHAALHVPATRNECLNPPTGSTNIEIADHFADGQPWVSITCLDRELEPAFLRFCESLFPELQTGRSSVEAISIVLHRYRLLFATADGAIGTEKIKGLFSELVALEWLLRSQVSAVEAWLGPFGETHDFILGNVHIEVKTLPASGERRFRTSNLRQLEEPEEGALFLLGIRLKPGGLNIDEQFARVRDLADPEHVDQLEKGMAESGCPLPVTNEWNAKRFSADTPSAWRVDEKFPRLVPSMLPGGSTPAGVSGVQYNVSLEAAPDEVRFDELFGKIKYGHWG